MVSARSSKRPRWRTLLLQPTWMAGAISVGFHGVLFAAGPSFSNLNLDTLADPDALTTSRRVPLVELTLEERRHLPDFSNSFYSLSSLEDFETTKLPPSMVPSLPKGNSSTPATRSSHPRTTITEPVTVRPAPHRYRPTPTATGGTNASNPATAETSDANGTNASTPSEDNTAESTQTSDAATTTESTAQDLALNPNSPAAGNSENASDQRPAVDQPQSFAYNSDTLAEAWGRWLDQINLSPQAQPLPPERWPLAYVPGQSACPNIDQEGLVAALVNAEGKLLEGSVALLKSTGNPGLDRWAQADGIQAWAHEFKFPETSQAPVAYLLEVFVAGSEICN